MRAVLIGCGAFLFAVLMIAFSLIGKFWLLRDEALRSHIRTEHPASYRRFFRWWQNDPIAALALSDDPAKRDPLLREKLASYGRSLAAAFLVSAGLFGLLYLAQRLGLAFPSD